VDVDHAHRQNRIARLADAAQVRVTVGEGAVEGQDHSGGLGAHHPVQGGRLAGAGTAGQEDDAFDLATLGGEQIGIDPLREQRGRPEDRRGTAAVGGIGGKQLTGLVGVHHAAVARAIGGGQRVALRRKQLEGLPLDFVLAHGQALGTELLLQGSRPRYRAACARTRTGPPRLGPATLSGPEAPSRPPRQPAIARLPANWPRRIAAPPHRRTAAPPHRRTAAPPHRRTAAPPVAA
jgi:serine/arginine repetitive matrix protein 2